MTIHERSVFADRRPEVYSHVWEGSILVGRLAGGVPNDPRVIEGWLKTKLGIDAGAQLRELLVETIVDRGVEAEQAVDEVIENLKLNGFKRHAELGLYYEGRQLKAAIKEAANICWPKRRWGPSNKGTRSFFAEHLFVVEERLYLGVKEPSEINQHFVHTFRGSSIQYEEVVDDAKFDFTAASDFDFQPDDWAELWLTAESNGIGACRSQGFGTFAVTKWQKHSKRAARQD